MAHETKEGIAQTSKEATSVERSDQKFEAAEEGRVQATCIAVTKADRTSCHNWFASSSF